MIIASVKDLEILVLSSEDARSWAYFPHAAIRIAKFCKMYDSDADPLLMVAQLKMAFVDPKPSAFAMLLLERGVVVGHLLITLEHWMGSTNATIVQVEADRPIPRHLAKEVMAYLEAWSAEKKCNSIRCLARDERIARIFRIFYGFRQTRVVMHKDISPSAVVVANATS